MLLEASVDTTSWVGWASVDMGGGGDGEREATLLDNDLSRESGSLGHGVEANEHERMRRGWCGGGARGLMQGLRCGE